MNHARRTLGKLWRWTQRGAGALLLIALLGDGHIAPRSLMEHVTALSREHLFDYVGWEVHALAGQAWEELRGTAAYLDQDAGRAVVLDYFARLERLRTLQAQIERAYADPNVRDADAATAAQRAERDTLRAELNADRALTESVLESQISAVLVAEGFGLGGQVLPPVAMHLSDAPLHLVLSPRERIEYLGGLELTAMPLETRDALERRITSELDVSALIVPLGGLSLYPSMVVEPRYGDRDRLLARAIEVAAHEWAHHYLTFYPLGWEYSARPETRTINETTATFFGRAVASRVLVRYYPDVSPPAYPSFLKPAAAPTDVPAPPPHDPDAPPPFDFARELAATRAEVDFLLWQGRVQTAELYMEYRRREFVRHGYRIRKLNQAYFAFYGGYQGTPGGAGGADRVGVAVETLLERSESLADFLRALRSVTRKTQLLALTE